jgi:hypothetical protein
MDFERELVDSLFSGVPLTPEQFQYAAKLISEDSLVSRKAAVFLQRKVLAEVIRTQLSDAERHGLRQRISTMARIPLSQPTSAANAVNWQFFEGEQTGAPIFRATAGASTFYFSEPRPRSVIVRPAKYDSAGKLIELEQTKLLPVTEKDIKTRLDSIRVGNSRPLQYLLEQAETVWRKRAGL